MKNWSIVLTPMFLHQFSGGRRLDPSRYLKEEDCAVPPFLLNIPDMWLTLLTTPFKLWSNTGWFLALHCLRSSICCPKVLRRKGLVLRDLWSQNCALIGAMSTWNPFSRSSAILKLDFYFCFHSNKTQQCGFAPENVKLAECEMLMAVCVDNLTPCRDSFESVVWRAGLNKEKCQNDWHMSFSANYSTFAE